MEEQNKRSVEEAYQQFCAGDESAFDFVMEEFRQNLIFFLFRYVRSMEAAEDLAEDTFVELLVHRERFRHQSSLKTYLFSVARHKAIDFIRREQRRGSVALEEIVERCDETPCVEEQILTQERNEALYLTLQELRPEYREVLQLLYVERLSYDEIAKIMKRSKKQIDNLAYRARQHMRGILGKEELFLEEP
ncbi:MAG: RNA polymerase sigma factor [Oscillospiraceae bacterium]|nr:RNA polymerase sigma factor [Oscillospiraceae bacterium]